MPPDPWSNGKGSLKIWLVDYLSSWSLGALRPPGPLDPGPYGIGNSFFNTVLWGPRILARLEPWNMSPSWGHRVPWGHNPSWLCPHQIGGFKLSNDLYVENPRHLIWPFNFVRTADTRDRESVLAIQLRLDFISSPNMSYIIDLEILYSVESKFC